MTGTKPVFRTAFLLAALLLGACRSVDPDLGLASTTTPAEPLTAATAAPTATAADKEPIQFLPVVGIPPERAPALSAALAAAADASGLPILPATSGIAAKRLKGYLSAMRDTSGTLVVYVWDVVDPAGNRIDRIQGQVRASGGGEPWNSVGDETLQAVARETIMTYAAHEKVASQ